MAVSINSIKNMESGASADLDIPEGKVEQVCRQWLVHEDGGLAYRLQSNEIQDHLNQNKFKSQLVRSDLMQAQTLQQLEMIEQQDQQQYHQQMIDEQLAKEMQLKLIEEEQRQEAEKQKLLEQDERLALKLSEKEKQKALRRKLAKEQAQIEKIKRERLGLKSEDGQSNGGTSINDTMRSIADDMSELDLREFALRSPVNAATGEDVVNVLNAQEQDEELARFLQMVENQRRTGNEMDAQSLLEHQDYEIARLLYEEEKAKVRRAKEKRLQKQLAKQQRQNQLSVTSSTSSATGLDYSTGEPIYANQSQIVQQRMESYYEDPIQMTSSLHSRSSSQVECTAFPVDHQTHQTGSERPNVDIQCENQMNPLEISYESSNVPTPYEDSIQSSVNGYQNEPEVKQVPMSTPTNSAINQRSSRVFTIYDSDEPVINFVNRGQNLLPVTFHNIAMDIDPTYNRRQKQNHMLTEHAEQVSFPVAQSDSNLSTDINAGCNNGVLETINAGIHFAELARVSPVQETLTVGHVAEHPEVMRPEMMMPKQVAANVDEYIQFAMQQRQNALLASGYSLPVHGQRRHISSGSSNKKIKNKERNKDMCRQQ